MSGKSNGLDIDASQQWKAIGSDPNQRTNLFSNLAFFLPRLSAESRSEQCSVDKTPLV